MSDPDQNQDRDRGRARSDDRDRDERGRARNARGRDQLGRPLPRGQVGVTPWPEDSVLGPTQALSAAQDLLDRGWPFQAHEVLEGAWKTAPRPERGLWQGLAQLAVGMTHAARGNTRGAAALLRRGSAAIEPYRDAAPHGIDVPGVLHWAATCLEVLAGRGDGPIVLGPPRLRRP